jgi:hypothetical protein
LRRAQARWLSERRRIEGGVRYFKPYNEDQEKVLHFTKFGILVKGGNRGGKTVIGAVETTYRALGEHPYKKVHQAPVKIWVCSQDLPGRTRAKKDGEQEVHKQLEQLRKWIPQEALRGGRWEKAFSPGEMTLSLRNGSMIVFKGYDQGALKFESDAIHFCFDPETEVLTGRGWLGPDEIREGDEIYTLNTATGKMEWKPCRFVYRARHRGRMVRLRRGTFDAFVTPDHRWPVVSRKTGQLRIRTTDEVSTNDAFLRAAEPGWEQDETFEDAFVQAVAWVLTDGTIHSKHGQVAICQVRPENKPKIRAILGAGGALGKETIVPASGQQRERSQWTVKNPWGKRIRELLGPDKHLPMEWVRALSRRQLELFYESLLDGDGHRAADRTCFVQKSRHHISDLFQLVCVLLGKPCRTVPDGEALRTHVQTGARYGPRVNAANVVRTDEEYDGLVWCPNTENGTVVARRKGCVYISGNCWMDEEPDDRNIWTSITTRLADYDGQWMITFTPVLSLYGRGWLKSLWEQRNAPDCEFEIAELFPTRNPHISADALRKIFSSYSDEERAVRERGDFALLGGAVLSELTAEHYFDPEAAWGSPVPPVHWRHYLIIDPGGSNATAGLWASVDPDGNIWLWGEHYVRDQLPDYHMACLHAQYRIFCQYWGSEPEISVRMDPAGWQIGRTLARGKDDTSVRDEFELVADILNADWFNAHKADNADVWAWRVKRYLKHRRLRISQYLKWWKWEAEKWRRVLPPQGFRAQEIPEPERPIEKDNHLMACVSSDTLVAVCRDGIPQSVEAASVRLSDLALTRNGWRSIRAHWLTGEREVYCITFSDGRTLTATGDHPIWVEGKQWVEVQDLQAGDEALSMLEWNTSSGAGKLGTVTPTPNGAAIESTSGITELTCTSPSGSRPDERFPRDTRSITKMGMRLTTPSGTSFASRAPSIADSTLNEGLTAPLPEKPILTECATLPSKARSDVPLPRKDEPITLKTEGERPDPERSKTSSVSDAETLTERSAPGEIASATPTVVPLRVVRVERAGTADVYNIQVDETPEFFASGVLTHNCTRYMVNELPEELPVIEPARPQTWEDRLAEFRRTLQKRGRVSEMGNQV